MSQNPQAWQDFRVELELCLRNALVMLKAQGQTERDYWAGKVNGLEEILGLGEKLKKDQQFKGAEDV